MQTATPGPLQTCNYSLFSLSTSKGWDCSLLLPMTPDGPLWDLGEAPNPQKKKKKVTISHISHIYTE